MTISNKTVQNEIIINEFDKQKLEKAAQIKHNLYNELLLLNNKDSELVFNLLNSSIEPNERLKNLFK